ncbi:MAG TPA: glycosyltransferase family 87 protein, partial [Oligoflexia bacterium]|nr:glycosyltransferase family 87 protein [Oligoflexia bacterium]
GPAQMWYGPWGMLLLGPVLILPYHAAAAAWFLLNICFLCLSSFISWRLVNGKSGSLAAVLFSGLLFFPNLELLAWNQIGGLITLGLVGFLALQERRKDFLAGACLVPCSLKPHLFFLFAPVFLWWSFKERRFRPLAGFSAVLAFLAAASEKISPGIIAAWCANLQSPPFIQKTPTLVGIVRGAIFNASGSAPLWPALFFPSAALLCLLVLLMLRRPTVDWLEWYVPLAAASLFFAPYAFIHDQTMLLIGQSMLLGAAFTPDVLALRRRQVIALCAALQTAAFLLSVFLFTTTPPFFWFPLGMLFLWRLSRRILRKGD